MEEPPDHVTSVHLRTKCHFKATERALRELPVTFVPLRHPVTMLTWLIFSVSLAGFRITMEIKIWLCSWPCFQILTEGEEPPSVVIPAHGLEARKPKELSPASASWLLCQELSLSGLPSTLQWIEPFEAESQKNKPCFF